MIFEWGRVCGDPSYQVSYRLNFCVEKGPLDDFKEGGNGLWQASWTFASNVTDLTPAVYNVLMDFVFAAFPWLIVWRLEMKFAEKIGICVVMSLVCYALWFRI